MNTYYGKPIVYGAYTVVTAWETNGTLFHNPRVYVKRGQEVISVRSFCDIQQAIDEAQRLWLNIGKTGNIV